jgi:hypothetical protein
MRIDRALESHGWRKGRMTVDGCSVYKKEGCDFYMLTSKDGRTARRYSREEMELLYTFEWSNRKMRYVE